MATLRVAFLSALVLELIATLGVAPVAVSIGLRLVFGEMTLAFGLTVLLLAPVTFSGRCAGSVGNSSRQDGKAASDKAFELIAHYPAPPVGCCHRTGVGVGRRTGRSGNRRGCPGTFVPDR
jgi:ATP-binding cassette, subfamily C, bacterial CydD